MGVYRLAKLKQQKLHQGDREFTDSVMIYWIFQKFQTTDIDDLRIRRGAFTYTLKIIFFAVFKLHISKHVHGSTYIKTYKVTYVRQIT